MFTTCALRLFRLLLSKSIVLLFCFIMFRLLLRNLSSGILFGIGYKENARSALITRGLTELVRFGTYFGAKKETFFGLTGIGDLMLTCSSKESRNFSFGEEIGRNDDALSVIKNNTKTVEGLNAVKVIDALSKFHNI